MYHYVHYAASSLLHEYFLYLCGGGVAMKNELLVIYTARSPYVVGKFEE